MFSPSDLRHVRGKPQRAVELLFIELREPEYVARELFENANGLRCLVYRARKQLAAHGVTLPDRRLAMAVGQNREYAF